MAKKYRRLQHISTIPILAALLLTSNPAAIARTPLEDISRTDNGTGISIRPETDDSRLKDR
ncbi:MAG: hypothetical protein KBD06_01065 [Candidatus Pacebacteria bacterium]|nr:hypothetical protein [Candidatus Paceibacterota bacterium]